MRFIPTSAVRVDQLKKQAKKLQRNGGGKHTDLLNRVARSAGYEHWHHVALCLAQTEPASVASVLLDECYAIVRAELAGELKIVMTGPEATTTRPLVLFSTGIGDAWLLDAEENRAACLVWQSIKQSPKIVDAPTRLEIQWDGSFELAGEFFKVATEHAEIGVRAIGGYPLEELRKIIDQAQSVERRMDEVIFQNDAIELTPDVAAQLVRSGWSSSDLADAARNGARYSPSRNSLLFPVEFGE